MNPPETPTAATPSATSAAPLETAARAAPLAAPPRAPAAAILTLGFGTAVALWGVGYFTHLPGMQTPAAVLGVTFLLMLLGAGAASARLAPGGVRTAALAGVVTAALNLLILGSLKPFRHDAGIALPGSLVAGAALAALGALVAGALGVRPRPDALAATGREWVSAFGRVACAATFLLIAVGGLVTSHDAGLAVPDWPRTYGSNMFLFPLERMTGGVYYEHTHRLLGALVGLTTLTLAGLVIAHDRRGAVRALAVVAFVAVCVQGVMGGLRVDTNAFRPGEQANVPMLQLAVAHGILAQLFFSALLALTAVTSTTWREAKPDARPSASIERELGSWLVGVLLVQLLLGALVRHFHMDPTLHIVGACAVVGLAAFAGARAWGLHGDRPALGAIGAALAILVFVQLLLGIAALIVTNLEPLAGGARRAYEAPLATVHQTAGASLLGLAVLLRLWTGRLLADPPPAAAA